MAIQNNSSLFLSLPPKTQERVSSLAKGLIAAIQDETTIRPDSLLGFLTNLIRDKNPSEASTNTHGWLRLLQSTNNQNRKEQIATSFILEHAPKYFTRDSNKYKKDEYLERFLPKGLTDGDFKHLQHLASIMNPPVDLQDTPENRKSILDEKKANLKATLAEWFNYLNDENGGLAYLDNKTRHWIFNSVANLELRVLDDKPNLETLEEILKNPEARNSHTEIDTAAFEKFKDILEKYQSRSLDQEEIKNEINKYTNRDPSLDFDYGDKLSKLFSNDEIDKIILYSLVLNDPRGTKVNFQNRKENSIKDFPVLNPALIGEVNDIVKFCETQTATDIKAKIKEKYATENPDLAQFLVDNIQINKGNATSSLNFAALYALLQNQSQKEIDLTTTDGEWRRFPKGSDANELRDSIKAFNTGWCVQGLETAQNYLNLGDFYIYYSKDAMGKPTIPRLAIAMTDNDITEIRGIAAKQNLDSCIANAINENGRTILAEKLYSKDDRGEAVFPNSEQWLRADKDMKDLTILHTKFKNKQQFTDKDLFFIYEVFGSIQSFGRQADPRISEILEPRDRTEDFRYMMNLTELPTGELEKLRTQTDGYGNNALMLAACSSDKEALKLILNIAATKLNPNEFKTFFTQTNKYDDNALTRAECNGEKETVGLILNTAIAKLSPDEFKTFLTQTNKDGNNALIGAAWNGDKETVGLILNTAIAKLSPDEFKTFLTQTDGYGNNALMLAACNGDKETVGLILNTAIAKLSPDEFKTFLTQTNKDDENALIGAADSLDEKTVELILKTAIAKLSPDEFRTLLIQAKREALELILKTAIAKLSPDEFTTFFTQTGLTPPNGDWF
jgi:ankyrin repeat protein